MNYGSVCSGVEAASLAWEKLGWKPKFFAEIEPFPAAVLKERWLNVPNLGDFTKIEKGDYRGAIDLLAGGTPCQSFSVSGLRQGLADERGNLALEFVGLAYALGAKWVIWENVPGVLSSNGGKDFAGLLSLFCGWDVRVPNRGWRNAGIITPAPECYGLAWRVFDAQHVRVDGFPRAVPQRRRRVFVVAYLGDWRSPAEVLFEQKMCSRNTPASRKKENSGEVASRLKSGGRGGYPSSRGENLIVMGSGSSNAGINTNISPTIICAHDGPPIIFYENHGSDNRITETTVSPTITRRAGTGGNNLPLVQRGGGRKAIYALGM